MGILETETGILEIGNTWESDQNLTTTSLGGKADECENHVKLYSGANRNKRGSSFFYLLV